MDKFLWVLVLILVMAGAAVVGMRLASGDEDTWLCQNNQWVKHGNPSAPMPITACVSSDNQNLPARGSDLTGSGTIEWSRALSMIKNCEVLRIAQTRNRNIDMWLKDGRQVWTVEPNVGDAVKTAQSASKCGIIPISTE